MDIERMRKKFVKKMSRLDNTRRQRMYEWRTKEWIQNAISFLETTTPSKFWTKEQCTTALKYKIGIRDGKKVIHIKDKTNGGNPLEMVAIEDYFDVIYKAHIETGHSARLKMLDYLREKGMYVPFAPTHWFVKFCKICQAQKLAPTKRTMRATLVEVDYHGFVELINMSKSPDGVYKYVMHYRDITTNFLFLRPLRTSHVTEVADELLKLFLTYGFPSVIHTPITIAFTTAVVNQLSIAMPDCLIVVGNQMQAMKKIDGVEANIHMWMKDNESNNWSTGISFVANQMNLRKTKVGHRYSHTAYKALIGTNPKKGLVTHGLRSVLKKLKYEEDLEKIVQLHDNDNTSNESSQETDEEDSEDEEIAVKGECSTKISGKIRNYNLTDIPCESKKVSNKDAEKSLPPTKQVRMYTKKPKLDQTNSYFQTVGINNDLLIKEIRRDELPLLSMALGNKVSNLNNITVESKYNKNIVQTKAESTINITETAPSQEITNKQITIKTTLCVNKSLRELSDTTKVTKQKQKLFKLWSTENIDLPSNSDQNGHVDIDLGITNLSDGNFGEIPNLVRGNFEETETNIACDKSDYVNSEEYSRGSLSKDELTFGKIVKVESLTTDNDEDTASETLPCDNPNQINEAYRLEPEIKYVYGLDKVVRLEHQAHSKKLGKVNSKKKHKGIKEKTKRKGTRLTLNQDKSLNRENALLRKLHIKRGRIQTDSVVATISKNKLKLNKKTIAHKSIHKKAGSQNKDDLRPIRNTKYQTKYICETEKQSTSVNKSLDSGTSLEFPIPVKPVRVYKRKSQLIDKACTSTTNKILTESQENKEGKKMKPNKLTNRTSEPVNALLNLKETNTNPNINIRTRAYQSKITKHTSQKTEQDNNNTNNYKYINSMALSIPKNAALRQKMFKAWNTNEIDLPSPLNESICPKTESIPLLIDNLETEFGEIPKFKSTTLNEPAEARHKPEERDPLTLEGCTMDPFLINEPQITTAVVKIEYVSEDI